MSGRRSGGATRTARTAASRTAAGRAPGRRAVLAAAVASGAAAVAAALAGCSRYGDGPPPAQEPPPPRTGGGGGGDGGDGRGDGGAGEVLVRVSEVPVGGGTVLKDRKVVVAQPREGEFTAFSAVCTHQGCTVAEVSGGIARCPCHGSGFRITDGSVASGPAGRPLPRQAVTVVDGTVRRA
ncbi:Rieske (2Fe-2S) protein [Streptomyces sp. URMC 123]|uniref:Rieske (2Fe-2S) protein n=1 Tax=Streptomyces sp. URMC 123 TaxID=3423403 RepID=UPI003F1C1282